MMGDEAPVVDADYANVTRRSPLMIAVSGGTAFAASHLITGKQIAKGTISSSANIKSHSLLASNFKKGQIPAGATGPQGAAGAPGAASAAGSAIAYGDLEVNGNGNPQFNATLTKGFTSASSPSAGVYCIPYPPGVSTNIPLAISDSGNEDRSVEPRGERPVWRLRVRDRQHHLGPGAERWRAQHSDSVVAADGTTEGLPDVAFSIPLPRVGDRARGRVCSTPAL